MHSFHQSHGRVLFEALCAFGMVASCVGAWKQTGASALLAAAAIAGLYGFVHLFDLRHGKPAEAIEPQRIDFVDDDLGDVMIDRDVPSAVTEPQPQPSYAVEEVDVAVPATATATASKRRKARAPRKGTARIDAAADQMKVADLVLSGDTMAREAKPFDELEPAAPVPATEEAHPRIEQLFEPDPHFRQKRAAFGRRYTIR
jgi:hypothetical protein